MQAFHRKAINDVNNMISAEYASQDQTSLCGQLIEIKRFSVQIKLIYTVNSRVIDYIMIEHASVPQESNK
jgi:hypothetical protein